MGASPSLSPGSFSVHILSAGLSHSPFNSGIAGSLTTHSHVGLIPCDHLRGWCELLDPFYGNGNTEFQKGDLACSRPGLGGVSGRGKHGLCFGI